MEMENENIIGAKKHYLAWIISAVILIGVIAVICSVVFSSGSNEREVQKQLELAVHYIEELDYEQAIVAYQAAIAIDPKNVDAYLGLADAYENIGEHDKAKEVLTNARGAVDNDSDLDKINKKREEVGKNTTKEPEPTVTPTPEPVQEAEEVGKSAEIGELSKAKVGDTVFFGDYEQDNDISNGKEPIEWIVLDEQDGKYLLISKYCIDARPYNNEWVDVTWETCSLRAWLNDDFCKSAFTKAERKCIESTILENNDNPAYGTEGGNNTEDKVFLLSIDEALDYFNSDSKRYAKTTEYAKARGAWTTEWGDEYDNQGWWLLRSPGYVNTSVADVGRTGSIFRDGSYVSYTGDSIRPAMWVTPRK